MSAAKSKPTAKAEPVAKAKATAKTKAKSTTKAKSAEPSKATAKTQRKTKSTPSTKSTAKKTVAKSTVKKPVKKPKKSTVKRSPQPPIEKAQTPGDVRGTPSKHNTPLVSVELPPPAEAPATESAISNKPPTGKPEAPRVSDQPPVSMSPAVMRMSSGASASDTPPAPRAAPKSKPPTLPPAAAPDPGYRPDPSETSGRPHVDPPASQSDVPAPLAQRSPSPQPTSAMPAEDATPDTVPPSTEPDAPASAEPVTAAPLADVPESIVTDQKGHLDAPPPPLQTPAPEQTLVHEQASTEVAAATTTATGSKSDDAPTADNGSLPPTTSFGSKNPNRSAGSAVTKPRGQKDIETSPQRPMLFEIAWEVCWQLGGIYTVLKTKAPTMQAQWGENYFLIGPYNPQTAAVEFEELASDGVIREALDALRADGIPCHYGRWLIPGRPRVILLDYRARYGQLHVDKYLLWKDHGISAPSDDGEVNEVVAFGSTVAQFFAALGKVATAPLLAHFHEWMGAFAIPRIAHLGLPVTTVFTTHATLLGRYLANNNPYFYDHLRFVDPDREAAKFQIFPRYALERAAAHSATVFTTVSDVTAREAEKLIGRKPDAILPNGLNVQRFAALHEFQNLHREYKERIQKFVMGHFFPSYSFDLDNTLYFFTSGRYEYRNKGMDLFIEGLHRLNHRMKGVPNLPTIVAFIITRAANRHINVTALQNQSMLEDLRNTCREIEEQIGQKLFTASASGRVPQPGELLSDDQIVRLKRTIFAMRSHQQPLIVTHDLMDDGNDGVLAHLRHRHMLNAADDPVKMVFHPEFVTATSPLLGLDYEQFVRGCHLGVFPSYYEPWGYTPMECAVMGVPSVTSDLSGFGSYVQKEIDTPKDEGIMVLNRTSKGFEESADELADYLFEFVQQNRRQRIELRNRVERLSEKFDWSTLAQAYHKAHGLALRRTDGKPPGSMQVKLL